MSNTRQRDAKGRYTKSNGQPIPLQAVHRFGQIIDNVLLSRQQLTDRYLDPRRDINHECGYPQTESITVEKHYRIMYDREPIATRVVQVLPQESWQVQPTVYESEEADEVTAFEQGWKDLGCNLRGKSWYQDEEGSPIWEYLHRIDELSGIGRYGVLLLGLGDGRELYEPVETAEGMKLLYLRAFDESLVSIVNHEKDRANPRYGQPIEYMVSFDDPTQTSQSGTQLSLSGAKVHWSRVVHVADNLGSSELFGVPRMRPVYNRLHDLCKLYGGSAEMYWRGAFPGLSIETHPQLQTDVQLSAEEKTAMRTQMEQYMGGLQRYLSLIGMSAKSLAPQVVDPTPQINAQIMAICIQLGIPKRVFTGSERGELASTQDDSAWNDRLAYRQNNYITPRLIVPFIDRLITLGVLPEPVGYSVVWPDLNTLTDEQKADIAIKRTEAMVKYIQGSVEALMVPLDYLTRVIGLSQDEAAVVLEAVLVEEPEEEGEEVVKEEAVGVEG